MPKLNFYIILLCCNQSNLYLVDLTSQFQGLISFFCHQYPRSKPYHLCSKMQHLLVNLSISSVTLFKLLHRAPVLQFQLKGRVLGIDLQLCSTPDPTPPALPCLLLILHVCLYIFNLLCLEFLVTPNYPNKFTWQIPTLVIKLK